MDLESIHILLDNYTLGIMKMIKDKETALFSINKEIYFKENIKMIKEVASENIISQTEKDLKENTKTGLLKALASIIS